MKHREVRVTPDHEKATASRRYPADTFYHSATTPGRWKKLENWYQKVGQGSLAEMTKLKLSERRKAMGHFLKSMSSLPFASKFRLPRIVQNFVRQQFCSDCNLFEWKIVHQKKLGSIRMSDQQRTVILFYYGWKKFKKNLKFASLPKLIGNFRKKNAF